MGDHNNHIQEEQDEAMEWITDWDYERVLPPEAHSSDPAPPAHHTSYYHPHHDDHHQQQQQSDDDASMGDVEDDDEDVHDPLPLDAENDPRHHESSQEIAIFWTRATEELTDEELNGMFGDANATHPLVSSRRNSRDSLGFLMEAEVSAQQQPAADEDEDLIMGPLQDKEGLLPPMSESQLFHQGNAQYGMIESHAIHASPVKSAPAATVQFPSDSTGTHTTVDLMDDTEDDEDDDAEEEDDEAQQNEEYVSATPANDAKQQQHPDAIFERQQQLLHEVLQQAPSSAARRSSYELPRPSDHQQRLLQEMKERPAASNKKRPPQKEDPIFARQQQIFQQLREHEEEQKQQQQQQQQSVAHYHPYNNYNAFYSNSPVSVTKTLTRAGMDSDEYQKVVTRLTEKNLMERQRAMLQESMKRSLETRQALHIKPTALPDYNHDKLSQVLKDIEVSSRSISETYGRR